MNKKKILPLLFLIVGVVCAINGLLSMKSGKVRGWGEDKFIRTTYTVDESPELFWLYSGGYVAVGSIFTIVSLIVFYRLRVN